MVYKNLSVSGAAYEVINKKLKENDEGGVSAVDKNGNIAQPLNLEGMYWGWVKPRKKSVAIY